jgi:O-antigen/teichoic acid export membrane protein
MLLPGIVGGLLLNQRILRIYGGEFQVGDTVLLTLLLAVLLRSYYRQMVTTFNAIDRADITFRINAAFITANVVLNVGLIYRFGWFGAAATALSTGLATTGADYYLTRVISFNVPYVDIAKQLFAVLIMGGYVFASLWIERTYTLIQHNFALVLILVGTGARIYFASLLALSDNFRTTVSNNLREFV